MATVFGLACCFDWGWALKHETVNGHLPLWRMLAVVLALVAFVLVPFIIWGEQMDRAVPRLVEDQTTKWAIALTGVALLVADVLLPVPSSIVSISLCLLLGPAWGVPAVFAGMVGAFALGYFSGLLLPADRLRAWVGARTWDSLVAGRQATGMLWIASSRPIPVLAEVTAILAGSLRLPFGPSLLAAAASSLLVATAYGAAAWLGLDRADSSIEILVICAACLPAASWVALQVIRRA